MKTLDVYLHGDRAGTLERRPQAKLSFVYASEWVESGGAPLSLSLPVRAEPYDHDECAPYFEGLLPEGDFLKAIARTLHVSARNPFQLLTAIGDKIGVLVQGGRIGLSRGRPPTTDILKAPIPGVADPIANEGFCLHLAGKAGLDVAVAEPRSAASHEYLLVHRYDRDGGGHDRRVHQEDLCQALGLVPAVKYEEEGGPRVHDCADLIRRVCSAPARDVIAFLDALLFNFLIANHDAHSKN